MTREEWAERLPLIQAFMEGKTIQTAYKGVGDWGDVEDPDFSCFDILDYRIKPEPKVIWVEYSPYWDIIYVHKKYPKKMDDQNTLVKYREVIE